MAHFIGNIEELTVNNNYFRRVLFTGKHEQLVVMSLKPGEEIGEEVHDDVDQFFRIEEGEAKFILNKSEINDVKKDFAVIVPAGTSHNVINSSKIKSLKLYTVYSSPKHADKVIHKTKQEADLEEHD